MTNFFQIFKEVKWNDLEKEIQDRTAEDAKRALASQSLSLDGFISLLSPAAEFHLETMAQSAQRLTTQRFGKVINLFAPLYLSNECTNSCRYCGFNVLNPSRRLTLTAEQAEAEALHLHTQGFRHLLLVSGEAPEVVTTAYLKNVITRLRRHFSSISIELYPMEIQDYQNLVSQGVDGLVVYQETYNERCYREVHPAGRKQDFGWRLETPERGGKAGFRRIGIGALLGLSNWRVEGFFLGLHARYLSRHFWQSHITLSFPRLRPATGGYSPPHPVSDTHLVQLLTALRLFLPDAGLILSTRETPFLRDHLIPLGITAMSAGSCTAPGGYVHDVQAEKQFEIADHRPAHIIADIIRKKGYEPVWKDWDAAFLRALPFQDPLKEMKGKCYGNLLER